MNGHFVLAVPPATPVEISVGAIGWTPLAGVPLTLAGPTGHVALIALQRRPVPPSPPHPPPPSNASFTTVRPSPDARVAGGALEGNVLDDSAGRPLPGARVTVARAALTWRLDSMNASRFELVETPVAAAVTDRTGRFHFSGLDADRVVIAVQLLGYGPATVAYAPARGIGYSTTIALPHHTPLICSDSPTSYPWVHVRVLDLVTGTAPDTATLVVLRDGHRASSSTPEGARSRVLQLGAGSFSGNQFAPSEVIVRSPGFSTWRAHDVRAQLEPCGGLGSVILTAWLLPQATEPR